MVKIVKIKKYHNLISFCRTEMCVTCNNVRNNFINISDRIKIKFLNYLNNNNFRSRFLYNEEHHFEHFCK